MYHFLIRLVEIWKLIVVETYSEGKWKKSLLNATSPRNKSYTFSEKRRVFGNSNSCQFEISFFLVRFYVSKAHLSQTFSELVAKFSVRAQGPRNTRLFKKRTAERLHSRDQPTTDAATLLAESLHPQVTVINFPAHSKTMSDKKHDATSFTLLEAMNWNSDIRQLKWRQTT